MLTSWASIWVCHLLVLSSLPLDMSQGHSVWMAFPDRFFLLFHLKPLLLIPPAYLFQNLSYDYTGRVCMKSVKYQLMLLSQKTRLLWKGVLYFYKAKSTLFDTYVPIFIFLKSWPSISFHWTLIRKANSVMFLAQKESGGLWEFVKQLPLIRLGLDPKSPSQLSIISQWLQEKIKHTRSTFLGAMWKIKLS